MVNVRHSRRRAIGCQTSSPHSSARSTAARSSGSAGNSEGSGASSSRRRMMAREPESFSPDSSVRPGTVRDAEAQALQRRVHRRQQLDDLVGNGLHLQRALHRGARVRAVDDVELRRHGTILCRAPRRRRRQHPDPLRDLSRRRARRALALHDRARLHGRRARRRAAQPARAARHRPGRPRRLDRVEHGAPAAPRVGGDGGALPRPPRCSAVGPGHQDRHGAALRQPARDRARPPGQRRGRLRAGSRARAWWSTSAPR